MKNDIKYSIDVVSKRSGLTKNTIRAWELRYNFLNPERTDTKRRLYSEDEIEKLSLLGEATRSGYKIGNIYNLTNDDLKRLLSGQSINETNSSKDVIFDFPSAVNAIISFDYSGFKIILDEALINNSKPVFIKYILLPLIDNIGDLWKKGNLRIAHEHFASSVITSVLIKLKDSETTDLNANKIVVCTPSGQRHELGALLASVIIASLGWNVIYLGVDLPAEEIAFVVRGTNAKAVAMSIVFPVNELQIKTELSKLDEYLPDTSIFVGSKVLSQDIFSDKKNITLLRDYSEIYQSLNGLETIK